MPAKSPEAERYGAEDGLDHSATSLRKAAIAMGIATRLVPRAGRQDRFDLVVEIGGQSYFYRSAALHRLDRRGRSLGHVNAEAAGIVQSKTATKAYLAAAGLPFPAGRAFVARQKDDAIAHAVALGWPVCVKPDAGRKGRDAFPDCRSRENVAHALDTIFASGPTAVVEQAVSGETYRFYYVEPEIVGARITRSLAVTGDGRSSVAELLEAINAVRRVRRVAGHEPVAIDSDMTEFLASIGMTPHSVPEEGRKVPLSPVANFSRGGADQVQISDEIHPSHREIAARAFAAIPGLKLSAIDMMIPRPLEPCAPDNGWILELNSSASIDSYEAPWSGEPQDVAGAILRMMSRDAASRNGSVAPLDPDAILLQRAAMRAGLPTSAMTTEGESRLRIDAGGILFEYRRNALRRLSPQGGREEGGQETGGNGRLASSAPPGFERGLAVHFFYARPHIAAVAQSRPIAVEGDGTSSILELVRRYRDRHGEPLHVTPLLVHLLAVQALDLRDVPPAGRSVAVGTQLEPIASDLARMRIHRSYADAAVAEAARNNLEIASIAMLIAVPSEIAGERNCRIVSIDGRPALRPFSSPDLERSGQTAADGMVAWLLRQVAGCNPLD